MTILKPVLHIKYVNTQVKDVLAVDTGLSRGNPRSYYQRNIWYANGDGGDGILKTSFTYVNQVNKVP